MSDKTALDKIAELQRRLREAKGRDVSAEDVESFVTLGSKLAGKAVLSALIEVLEDSYRNKGGCVSTARKLIAEVKSLIPYPFSGHVTCEFTETSHKLCISLTIAKRDYRTDVMIPSADYTNDLHSQYDFLKGVAAAYWRQWAEAHTDLYTRISNYRPDIDFSTLVVDPDNSTSMYFDPNCPQRLSLYCYYLDNTGQTYIKKPTKHQ